MAKRNKYRRKKRVKIKSVFFAIIFLIVILFGIKLALDFTKETIIFNDFYLSSDDNQISIYTFDEENKVMTETDKMYRGTEVKSNQKTKTVADINYTEIKIHWFHQKKMLSKKKQNMLELL